MLNALLLKLNNSRSVIVRIPVVKPKTQVCHQVVIRDTTFAQCRTDVIIRSFFSQIKSHTHKSQVSKFSRKSFLHAIILIQLRLSVWQRAVFQCGAASSWKTGTFLSLCASCCEGMFDRVPRILMWNTQGKEQDSVVWAVCVFFTCLKPVWSLLCHGVSWVSYTWSVGRELCK